MLSYSPRTLQTFSASIWLMVGSGLLFVGVRLLLRAVDSEITDTPLMHLMSSLSASRFVLCALLGSTGVALGCLKGCFALTKSANKLMNYYKKLPASNPLYRLYPIPYYALLGIMMGLGMLLNAINTPTDIRGFIDVAIGVALLVGGRHMMMS